MSDEPKDLEPAPPNFEYMGIMGYFFDTLRMIYGDTAVLEIIRQNVSKYWSNGLGNSKVKFGNTYQFKLNGYPLSNPTTFDEAIACKRMACAILHDIHNAGWELITSSDLTKTQNVFTWFFRRNPHIVRTQTPFICISVSSVDALHVLNAPQDIRNMIKSTIESKWPQGIRKYFDGDTSVFKLHGNPWISTGTELVHSRLIIQTIINELHVCGWALHTSTNLKNTSDALIFRHDPTAIKETTAGNFAINVDRSGKLFVIGATKQINDIIKEAIRVHWDGHIQAISNHEGNMEFALTRGSQRDCTERDHAVAMRYFILKLFETLMVHGWIITTSVSITRETKDKTCLIFQRCKPVQAQVFCLSLNQSERIRLINAPPDIIQTSREIIYARWFKRIKQEEEFRPGYIEFKLNGKPWSTTPDGHDGTHARGMLCFILQAFKAKNWKLLVSADVSVKGDRGKEDPTNVHSWYFVHDASLGASAPVMGQEWATPQMYPANDTGPPTYATASALQYSDEPPSYDSCVKNMK